MRVVIYRDPETGISLDENVLTSDEARNGRHWHYGPHIVDVPFPVVQRWRAAQEKLKKVTAEIETYLPRFPE